MKVPHIRNPRKSPPHMHGSRFYARKKREGYIWITAHQSITPTNDEEGKTMLGKS
jgi:hypothetical protein